MDVYTRDGNIIRQFPHADETTEVELEFLGVDVFWSRLFAMTTFYIAFRRLLGVDYVVTSSTQRRVVLRQHDFDERAQEVLTETMLKVIDDGNLLLGMADRYLVGHPEAGVLATNSDPALSPYERERDRGRVPGGRSGRTIKRGLAVGPTTSRRVVRTPR